MKNKRFTEVKALDDIIRLKTLNGTKPHLLQSFKLHKQCQSEGIFHHCSHSILTIDHTKLRVKIIRSEPPNHISYNIPTLFFCLSQSISQTIHKVQLPPPAIAVPTYQLSMSKVVLSSLRYYERNWMHQQLTIKLRKTKNSRTDS